MISDFVGAGIEGTLDFTQEKEFQGDPGKVFFARIFPVPAALIYFGVGVKPAKVLLKDKKKTQKSFANSRNP